MRSGFITERDTHGKLQARNCDHASLFQIQA
jgi:hypothetical protein